jgi:fibronectin type 3 domain-containing protein
MNSLNGTNRIFFNYSRSADAYDYRNNPGSIVGLTVAQEYDVVIVDTWAVPMVISNELSIIHQNQTRLIFYGSLANIAATTADIPTVFNVTATQEITGLTPAPYDGTGSGNIVYSSNSYAFYDTTSSVLAGLAGRTFEELEDNSAGGTGGQNPGICNTETSTGGIGDVFGFDIANMTGPSSNYLSHGVSNYDYDDNNRNPIFSYIGTLMSEKFNNTVFGENETLVYSFVWKHNNSLAPPGADLTDSTQLSQIRINMLSAVLQESNRVFTSDPKVRIDAFSIDIPSNSNKWFDLFVDGTVLENDIINGSMSITIDMPNEYQFQGCVPAQSGDFYINGILKSNSIRVSILTDHIVSIDIGDYSTDTISAGSSFRLELGAINTKLFKIAADETVYNWDVTIETGDYSGVTKTYAYAVDAGADNLAPNQVTGLAVVTASSSQLDLSWDATADNGGGTIAYYEIYRDTVLIDTTVATSYSDTSLTTGTTYTYSVVAVDDSGNAGPASVNVDGTTASGTPPPDVTGFTATAISSSQIDLSWTGIANIDSYNIYRDGALITNEVAGTTSFSDTGLTASTLYSYEIYAVNNTIESVNPGAASATTDPAASTEMYVSAISISYAQSGGGQNPQYTISVTFTVLDGDGNPVSGASVSFAYNAGSNAGSSSGVTGGSGTVTVGLGNGNKIRSGDAVVINVSNITLGGYTYNPALPGAVTNLSDLDGPPSGAST